MASSADAPLPAMRSLALQIELVALEKRRELIGDRDIVEIGEWNVGVALQADRRQLQDLGVSAVRIDEIDELLAPAEVFRPVHRLVDVVAPDELDREARQLLELAHRHVDRPERA